MRPIFNIELIIRQENKKVYVFKIEQSNYIKKNIDIRIIVRNLLIEFYVIIYNLERCNSK